MKQISEMMSVKAGTRLKPKRVEADEKTIFFLAEKAILALYGVRGRENIIPRYWKEGRLFVSCRSPLWANELWLTREVLMEKVNREIGGPTVKEIKSSE